jgi:hypothetical protein
MLHDDIHGSVSFTRNIETSVVCDHIRAIPTILVGTVILVVASIHLSMVDSEAVIIPTNHMILDAHLLQKKKIAQTDHKKDILH